MMKPLVVIPARGGSKGLPGKNIKLIHGKPLIHHTIDAARLVFDDECICVSTDSPKIIEVVEQTGLKVPFVRPDGLSTDTSSTQDVLLHAIDFYEQKGISTDVVVLLQPTSPFRNDQHIKDALKLYNNSLDMVVSVKESKRNPYYNLFEEKNGCLVKSKESDFIRRQDCPKVWEFNGAIYVINIKSIKGYKLHEFKAIRKYVMDEEDSIDIDNNIDWAVANAIFSSK